MSNYSLILSEHVSQATKIKVWELCVDKESILESFVKQVMDEGTYSNDLAGAIRYVELAADLRMLPKTRFREIKDQDINGKLFEAKKGSIRIYHFHETGTGRIIVLGGFKNNQTKDIKAAVKRIKDFQDEKQ